MSKSVGYMFVSRLPGVRQSGFIVKRNKFTWKAGLVDLGIAVLGTTTAWVADPAAEPRSFSPPPWRPHSRRQGFHSGRGKR